MKRILTWCFAVAMGLSTISVAHGAAEDAQDHDPLADLQWQRGPMTFPLGSKGRLDLPAKTEALSEGESNKFLKLTGNLPTEGLNIIAGGEWWATFEFDESGYVKDDEKIDADQLLKQLKDSDGPSNEERRKQGLPELFTDGWYVPPHYDSATKRLEWGLRIHASDDPQPVINYTVRVLGRSGYERVVLVSSPETLERDVAEFKQVLKGFDFNEGQKYSEFKPGDRVAEFGLAALVAGGAAAVATKTGFWKVLVGFLAAGWKLIAAAAVAVFAMIGRLFKRNRSSS
jgi:uncharacterized membrane-anchored protein